MSEKEIMTAFSEAKKIGSGWVNMNKNTNVGGKELDQLNLGSYVKNKDLMAHWDGPVGKELDDKSDDLNLSTRIHLMERTNS